MKTLIEGGADTEICNNNLRLTPLQVFFLSPSVGPALKNNRKLILVITFQCAALKLNEDCMKFLLKHGGSNPWVISAKGQTLIHLAAFSTFAQLMEIRERVSRVEKDSPDSIWSNSIEHLPFFSLETK